MSYTLLQQMNALEKVDSNFWKMLFKVLIEIQKNQHEQTKLLRAIKAKPVASYIPRRTDTEVTTAADTDNKASETSQNARSTP